MNNSTIYSFMSKTTTKNSLRLYISSVLILNEKEL